MNYITKDDFILYASRNSSNIDFAIQCVTPWHLLGAKAYIIDKIKQQGCTKGILLVRCLEKNKYYINENDLVFPPYCELDIFFEEYKIHTVKEKFYKFINIFRRIPKRFNDNVVDIVRPQIFDFDFALNFLLLSDSDCNLVCLDEGVGSYKTSKELFVFSLRRSKKTAINFLIDSLFNFCLECKLHIVKSKYTLLSNTKLGLVINKNVLNNYKSILLLNNEKQKICVPERYVLFLTQPFETSVDKLNSNIIISTFDKIADNYKRRGYSIVVKPHPRESKKVLQQYSEKDYLVINATGPIEHIIGNFTAMPEFVYGVHSTALVSISVIWEIKTVSIVKMINSEVSGEFRKNTAIFVKRFNDFISFPIHVEQNI